MFAPTDCAFADADPATIEAALADPTGLLTTVLGFHVVPGEELDAAALAGETSVTTLTGEELSISVEGDTVTVGDQAEVVVPDIETANATVHLIDAVMLPPSGDGLTRGSSGQQADGRVNGDPAIGAPAPPSVRG